MELLKKKLNSHRRILKTISLFLVILVFSSMGISVMGINILILNNFDDFTQISDSNNFSSSSHIGDISFELIDNSTLDSNSEMYRFDLTQLYYDFNFSIGFLISRDKPLDMQFSIILESEYDENGTYLGGNYSKICRISLIGFTGEYRDLLYYIEFFPNDSYNKIQSAVFISYWLTSEFFFSRTNGSMECLIKDGIGGYFHEKFAANHNIGLNRSLDAISIELVMNSLQCNSFTIDVNSITGELYDFVRENPETLIPTTPEITFDISYSSILMIISTIIVISFSIFKRKKSVKKII